MANNVILRKLYGYAVIELLNEPQSWQAMADKNFVPLLKVSRRKPSFKPDLKIFIETKKSHIWYVIQNILISNIYLSWAYWVSNELRKRYKPFPAQSKKIFFWPQNFWEHRFADYRKNNHNKSLVVDETAKVHQEDQRLCGFSNDVFVFDSSSAILKMEWRVNAWLTLRMSNRLRSVNV